jgi:FkbM family methyltransferase
MFFTALLNKIVNFCWRPSFINDLDTVINKYLSNKNKFTFIQVGSNNGKSNDPLFKFINLYNCTGVLIEPVKHIYDQLLINYEGRENIYFENIAISDTDSKKIFYEIKECNDSNLPIWYNQLSSFNLSTILSHKNKIPNIDTLIVEKEVQTNKIETIVEKYKLKEIDILHIDTEGYDFEIIKSIDFNKICPSILIYEHKHLSKLNYRKSIQKLNKYYNFIRRTSSGDTICARKKSQCKFK